MKYSAEKGCFLFEWEKRTSHNFSPQKNSFGYPWKNPLLAPHGKNPSDAHDRGKIK